MSAENFLCPAVVNTIPVIITDGFSFAKINFFLTVNIWQFKTFDFTIFTSYKLNIELNEQIFMNTYYSILLTKLAVTRLWKPIVIYSQYVVISIQVAHLFFHVRATYVITQEFEIIINVSVFVLWLLKRFHLQKLFLSKF